MADTSDTNTPEPDFFDTREPWEWLDDKEWIWLTNTQAINLESILQIEERYGQENVQVRTPAYDYKRVAQESTICAIFVKRELFEELEA